MYTYDPKLKGHCHWSYGGQRLGYSCYWSVRWQQMVI